MAVSLSISITQNSQSIGNNTSNVTVDVILKWTGGTWNNNTMPGTLYIDSTPYSFENHFNWGGSSASGSKTLFTKTLNISHSSDGTKTLNCYASFEYHSYKYVDAQTAKVLTTIPRATTPAVSGILNIGSSITISTASRASTNFTHNLYYSWGSQITDELIASGVTTSKDWTIPKKLAEYIMAGVSGTMYLKCVTYTGSTVVGTKTLTLIVNVPDTAEFRPTIQSISVEEANDLPFDRFVSGKSKLKFTISAVGAYANGSQNRNSYLVSATVQVDNGHFPITLSQDSPSTFSITSGLLIQTGARYAVVTVTDSRGRTASMSYAYTAYDYLPPQITLFTANRCLADGTLDESGTYVFCQLKTTVYSVDDYNAKTYKIVYENNGNEITLKSGTLADYADNLISYNSYSNGITFSVDYAYTVRAYVYDSFNSEMPAVATVIVPTEGTFMDWRDNGKGIAFGKVSTKDGFQVGWNLFDRFDTYVNNGLAVYSGSGDKAIDPDTTIEHCILTNKNTPTTDFWYVITLFYSNKTDTSNRVQYAFNYHVSAMYMRVYNSGWWNPWAAITMADSSYDDGFWKLVRWNDGRVELTCTYEVSNMACNTALGTWYRTAVFTPGYFPIEIENPIVTANYESDGYGALLWATTEATSYKTPDYYLIRPTSATIVSGKVQIRVTGKEMDLGGI